MKVSQPAYGGLSVSEVKEGIKETKIVEGNWCCRDSFAEGRWLRLDSVSNNFSGF